MFCYKDRSWCTAKDCANLKCDRNTRNKDVFNPDEFWSKYICYAVDIKNNCKDYVKEDIESTIEKTDNNFSKTT